MKCKSFIYSLKLTYKNGSITVLRMETLQKDYHVIYTMRLTSSRLSSPDSKSKNISVIVSVRTFMKRNK
jgi:hypothetical protein